MEKNWHPIETAPLDEWVMIYGDPWDADGSRWGVARCSKYVYERWESVSPTQKELKSEERVEWEGIDMSPTHWKRLPEPPEQRS